MCVAQYLMLPIDLQRIMGTTVCKAAGRMVITFRYGVMASMRRSTLSSHAVCTSSCFAHAINPSLSNSPTSAAPPAPFAPPLLPRAQPGHPQRQSNQANARRKVERRALIHKRPAKRQSKLNPRQVIWQGRPYHHVHCKFSGTRNISAI